MLLKQHTLSRCSGLGTQFALIPGSEVTYLETHENYISEEE
jgi:hypothetical protein